MHFKCIIVYETLSFASFGTGAKTQSAVIRNFEIIGVVGRAIV